MQKEETMLWGLKYKRIYLVYLSQTLPNACLFWSSQRSSWDSSEQLESQFLTLGQRVDRKLKESVRAWEGYQGKNRVDRSKQTKMHQSSSLLNWIIRVLFSLDRFQCLSRFMNCIRGVLRETSGSGTLNSSQLRGSIWWKTRNLP